MHRKSAVIPITLGLALGGLLLTAPGCGPSRKTDPVSGGMGPPPTGPGATAQAPTQPPDKAAPLAQPTLPPDRRVLIVEGDTERHMDPAAAVAAGYTLIDLSDAFAPILFQTLKDNTGQERQNRYRRIYMGLANDQLDGDGQPLADGEKNYLELFGIPPSLSVLRERFVGDQALTCEADIDLALLAAAKPVRHVDRDRRARTEATMRAMRARLLLRQRALQVETLAEVAAREPRLAKDVAELERWDAEARTLAEAEKRLGCEGLLTKKARHLPGVFDDAMQEAVRRFQQKHMIYEAPYLRPRTLAAMGRRFLENDYEALRRALRERVVAAAGVLEDGSAAGKDGGASYRGAGGDTQRVRDLVTEYSDAAAQQLGLTDAARALAFVTRRPKEEWRTLVAAVKLPPRPEYYAPHMDLQLVVDRGDVWYEPPFDEVTGKDRNQPREQYPSITLYLKYREQRFPLSRWRTTVGGWRSEQAGDGYEYFRYKGSDVGPRVIRNVASGPVWIAPETTPIRTLVKGRRVNGISDTVVNYDEIGPGFRSAYGLVAGYFVVPGQDGKPDWDNGIRAHGSADYLSIFNSEGFSHGCHRMQNHLAVRLYSFILQHRNMRVLGDQPLGYARQFLYKDSVYELRIPSRGYNFQLEPPLPVSVLEGRIKGERKLPFTEYIKKPGVIYPEGPVPRPGKGGDDRAGGE